jgi:zinc transport system substrate-binding protein
MLSGCSSVFNETDKLKVVTSIFPIGDILQNLGGEEVEVKVLIDPGVSPHNYDPKPSDVASIADADVVFMVGGEFDGWINQLVADAGVSSERVVQLKDFVNLRPYGGKTMLNENGETVDVSVTDENFDPHFWLSPKRVGEIVDPVTDKYKELDPDNAALYDWENDDFKTEIDALNSYIEGEVTKLTTRELITFHDSFGYLADDYGLAVIGTVEELAGIEPTPERMTKLNDLIKDRNLKVIFIEPQLSSDVVSALADDLRVQIGELDPIGGVGGRVTYQSLIRHNIIEIGTYMK